MRSLIRLSCFGIILFLISTISVKSQTYSFKHLGVEEGLSQSVITTIIQGDDGVFWVGTMSGLNRWDGKEFEVFMKNDGMAENWITSGMKDSKGNIWFGHWGGGISYYEISTEKLFDLKFEVYTDYKSVNAIYEDNSGKIWIATDGNGILEYDPETREVLSIQKKDGFTGDAANSMCGDDQGRIWFATEQGLVIHHGRTDKDDTRTFTTIDESHGLSSNLVNSVYYAGGNILLACTEFDGLNLIDVSDLQNIKIKTLSENNGLSSSKIEVAITDNLGNIWIGTTDKGVIKYEPETQRTTEFSTRQGLNYFKVNTLFEDREKNMWIGTDLGLNLFRGDEFLIYNEKDGLLNNIVWSIEQDNEGAFWMGTNEGLVKMKFADKGDNVERNIVELKTYTQEDGMSNNAVLSVYPNSKGEIWCGTSYGGVNVLSDGKFRKIDSLDGLASNTVFSVQEDLNGNHWVGTEKGVSRIDAQGNVENFDSRDGLGGDNIYKVFRDSKKRMWFASLGGYLSSYENGKFIRWDANKKLTQKFITSITEDLDGNIWFGAYGSGIFKYDGQDFKNYTAADGLSSNTPYSLICDNNNDIWVGTNQGFDKFNFTDMTIKNYSENEGFMGVEPNPNAICKDNEGNIWVGTIMGAVKFELSQEFKNKTEPVTILKNIKIHHEFYEFPKDSTFSYDQNHITFKYVGISLRNPEHVEYQYFLKGFDQTWSPVTNDQDVVYSNLPPGQYEFKIKASNNDNVWNELPTSYKFTIKPPFWQTWWFFVICVLLAGAALYYGDKYRTQKLIADKEKLEKKVEERTVEIAEKNQQLAQKNKDILDSIKYAKRIQTAILPNDNQIASNLKHSFVFFKPKDIVSGDFYWLEKVNGKILFAAADCTGHGVPGAFMSIIGHNGLNKIVREEGITTPSAILNRLDEFVSKTIQGSDDVEVRDGMDIALCSLDAKNMKLEYSGAFNPLYLVRDNELSVTKANRRPIGGFVGEELPPFVNHEIDVQKGDSIYIFSDGYPDQFGGPQQKKFTYKRFRELFVDSNDKEMAEQKKVLQARIKEWQGEIEQIDDIVIFGVKIV